MILTHVLLLVGILGVPAQESVQSLAGTWQVRLDPEDQGRTQEWFIDRIDGRAIRLPGTTDLAELGFALDRKSMSYPVPFADSVWPGRAAAKRLDQAGHLVRTHMYIGKAWYQREIEIPPSWSGRLLTLSFERVMWQSELWIDGQSFGRQDSLTTPHQYQLGRLSPGKHRLTVCVDNGMIHDIGILGHAYGPETQSRWNGMIGELRLTAKPEFHLQNLRVFAPADASKLRAEIQLHAPPGQAFSGTLEVQVSSLDGSEILATQRFEFPADARSDGSTDGSADGEPMPLQLRLPIKAPIETWSEFHPRLYLLTATLVSPRGRDQLGVRFGFRSIARQGRKILINGRPAFFRGTLDCAVYPQTGHPPTTVAQWRQTLQIIRDYGFNHVRFHSWCPPQAAFTAADQLGIYLCAETPFWVDNWTAKIGLQPKLLGYNADVTDFVRREIRRIQDAYGNHPSFAFFCIGNEFGMDTDWTTVQELLAAAKRHDPRHLYLGSTARKLVAADDYWVTHRTDRSVRGTGPARTDWDYAEAIAATELPVIAHETGQHPVYPDYPSLLPKFKGPLLPLNYQRLWQELQDSGLDSQLADFVDASARFQMVQYKAEHEAMLRTPDFGGYQLLMLNDFTGQSEALVGILDPFWQSKGVYSPADVRQWNAPTVPLARFEKYVWTNQQVFRADFELSHFGPQDLQSVTPKWSLSSADGSFHPQGVLATQTLASGALHPLGKIQVPLDSVKVATELNLRLRVGEATNQWKLWVYPVAAPESTVAPESAAAPEAGGAGGITISHQLDLATRQALADGGKVLLLAHGMKNALCKQSQFGSVYWSAGWWGDDFSNLGLLAKPDHPALAQFPTRNHSDWQWQGLSDGATTFLLEQAPPDYHPIVQLVPDFHHNRRLAQLFETQYGPGKLLVCGYDLTSKLEARPAARQLRTSLLQYLNSDAFEPAHALDQEMLQRMLRPAL
jgi:Glycosyl hydrolases family 2, sugar binding domain/Glycosyl hydrolases family 2, TIM barrel domain